MNFPAGLPAWLARLEARNPVQIALGLERVRAVWARLDLVFDIPVITVAGTNGKGSTCAFLEAMLQAGGYRVGLYTSPHLLRYNERVRIDGCEVGDAELCAAFAAVETARGGVDEDIPLTYFEQGTLAALWLFARKPLDALVLEVGLGGRLDAVNILDADCAVITPVDIDHQDWLGENREAIGAEKAGILRAGRPAVIGDRDPPCSLREEAAQRAAPVLTVGREIHIEAAATAWQCRIGTQVFSALPRPALSGPFQYDNAAVALAALCCLRDRLPLPVAAIRAGMVGAVLPGRFQIVGHAPLRIVDIAHNPHAARGLARQLADLPPNGRRIAVCAMLADKDAEGVVDALAGSFADWHVAGLDGPRGGDAENLRAVLARRGIAARVHADVGSAWQAACRNAGAADTICAFGSFHTVGAVLQGIRHGE